MDAPVAAAPPPPGRPTDYGAPRPFRPRSRAALVAQHHSA